MRSSLLSPAMRLRHRMGGERRIIWGRGGPHRDAEAGVPPLSSPPPSSYESNLHAIVGAPPPPPTCMQYQMPMPMQMRPKTPRPTEIAMMSLVLSLIGERGEGVRDSRDKRMRQGRRCVGSALSGLAVPIAARAVWGE